MEKGVFTGCPSKKSMFTLWMILLAHSGTAWAQWPWSERKYGLEDTSSQLEEARFHSLATCTTSQLASVICPTTSATTQSSCNAAGCLWCPNYSELDCSFSGGQCQCFSGSTLLIGFCGSKTAPSCTYVAPASGSTPGASCSPSIKTSYSANTCPLVVGGPALSLVPSTGPLYGTQYLYINTCVGGTISVEFSSCRTFSDGTSSAYLCSTTGVAFYIDYARAGCTGTAFADYLTSTSCDGTDDSATVFTCAKPAAIANSVVADVFLSTNCDPVTKHARHTFSAGTSMGYTVTSSGLVVVHTENESVLQLPVGVCVTDTDTGHSYKLVSAPSASATPTPKSTPTPTTPASTANPGPVYGTKYLDGNCAGPIYTYEVAPCVEGADGTSFGYGCSQTGVPYVTQYPKPGCAGGGVPEILEPVTCQPGHISESSYSCSQPAAVPAPVVFDSFASADCATATKASRVTLSANSQQGYTLDASGTVVVHMDGVSFTLPAGKCISDPNRPRSTSYKLVSAPASSKKAPLSTGAVIGIIVGGAALVAVLVGLLIYKLTREKPRKPPMQHRRALPPDHTPQAPTQPGSVRPLARLLPPPPSMITRTQPPPALNAQPVA